MKRIVANHAVLSIFLLVLLLSMLGLASAQVMTSTNYEIQSDSVNFGGGYSSSSNYVLESTAGEVGSGVASSTSYSLYAGYQQMQETYIAVSSTGDVILSPALPGLTGGTSSGAVSVHVLTDNPAGYSMSMEAATAPAMQGPFDTIADYVPVGAVPDFVFTTDPADAHFGFSPEGSDIAADFRDNGTICGVGSGDVVDRCWGGLSVAPQTIAETAVPNHPVGATTTIRFQVGIGGGTAVTEGAYTATTTVTVVPL